MIIPDQNGKHDTGLVRLGNTNNIFTRDIIMKSIEQLIIEESAYSPQTAAINSIIAPSDVSTTPALTSQSQNINEYSSGELAPLLQQSVNIHWQQAIELTGQGVHLTRWGYKKLGDLFIQYAEEEHQHAAIAISRLEFFDIDYQPITITPRTWKRHDVKSMIEFNLVGVKNASVIEKAVIKKARDTGDEITAQEFIPLLRGSDDGILEFERMLKLIEQMGIENFLTMIADPVNGLSVANNEDN